MLPAVVEAVLAPPGVHVQFLQQNFRTHFRLHMTQRAFRPPFTSVPSGAEVLLIVIAEHTSWAKADGRTISVSSFYNSRRQSRMPA